VTALGEPWWQLATAGCTANGAPSSCPTKFMRASAQIGWDEPWLRDWSHVCCNGCLYRPVFGVGEMTPIPTNGFH